MREETTLVMMFDRWFASYLQQDRMQVERLLRDRTATRFLIAWSLFESRCFDGFVQVKKFAAFSKEVMENAGFRKDSFLEAGAHFHSRYQNNRFYKNVMHKQKSKELDEILSKKFAELSETELIFLLLFVVYRFRNNIFHGNKGVKSWLLYKEQINLCLTIKQSLISLVSGTHNKSIEPTPEEYVSAAR